VRALAVLFVAFVLGCAIGDRDPGCAKDTDCAKGYVCRAAACMRLTTPIASANASAQGTGGTGGQ
jgi:hypothetical protein